MVYNWLINSLSSLLSPRCFLCGESLASQTPGLCPACRNDLPQLDQACEQCGNELTSMPGSLLHRCGSCLTSPPVYDRVITAHIYAAPVKQLVTQFKYQRQLAIGKVLADNLLARVQDTSTTPHHRVEAILPVPLHTARLKQRGFNQALELARPLARELDLPLLISSVRRHRNTPEQSSLTGKERRSNLRNAFSIKKPIPYKSIAIIDDVMTTGSTVEELGKLLKKNGVEYLEIWCAARAANRSG